MLDGRIFASSLGSVCHRAFISVSELVGFGQMRYILNVEAIVGSGGAERESDSLLG